MGPEITCVRHAQGHHNPSVANHAIHDPQLTPLGEEQCRALHINFPDMAAIDLVVASPMRRTLNTALLGFAPVITQKGLKVIALPEVQETSDLPCDSGTAVEDLKVEYRDEPVDFSLVGPNWNSKLGRWAPTAAAVEIRAQDARVWLMARPERNIVVVTHGGFLHYLTEDWSGSERCQGSGWANAEFRTYNFSSYEPEKAHLIETEVSRQNHIGFGKTLDHNERTQLHKTVPDAKNVVPGADPKPTQVNS